MLHRALPRVIVFVAAVIAAINFSAPGASAVTVYIAGDSTVMTYRASYHLYPQQGWGGRLPEYFTTAITWSNRAIGGRSAESFISEGRLASILSVIKPGDYLFVQFGHNEGHTDPYTTFEKSLAQYVDGAKAHGAIPVLVTPMGRRNFDSAGKFINDFVDISKAMKQVAASRAHLCHLIDLNAKSIAYYNSIGVKATEGVFLWLPAGKYPNWPNGVQDHTHFQENGANQMARLVTQGIKENQLKIAAYAK